MGQGELAVGDLDPRVGLPAELADGLDDLGHAAPVAGVVVAEPAAVGVERQPAVRRLQRPVADELAPLALLAEPQILEGHEDGDRERVVDRRVVHVAGRDPGLRERPRAGPDRTGVGEVDPAVVGVLGGLAVAEDLDRPAGQVRATSGLTTTTRAAAVGHHAAVQPMQRGADHRRVEHLLDGHGLAEQRVAGCTGRGPTPPP